MFCKFWLLNDRMCPSLDGYANSFLLVLTKNKLFGGTKIHIQSTTNENNAMYLLLGVS